MVERDEEVTCPFCGEGGVVDRAVQREKRGRLGKHWNRMSWTWLIFGIASLLVGFTADVDVSVFLMSSLVCSVVFEVGAGLKGGA